MGATLLKILGDDNIREDQFLDEETYKVYADQEGTQYLRQVVPSDDGLLLTGSENIGGRPHIMRHQSGRPAHVADLAAAATAHDAQLRANCIGKPVTTSVRDQGGKLVEMTFRPKSATLLDLGVTDVHQAATLPFYAAGYRVCQEGIADAMSPVIMVPKQADYYGTWNQSSDFEHPMGHESAAGAQVGEVSPSLAFVQYTTVPFALASALPTEVMANADAPFVPMTKIMQVIVDKLRLARNVRVANLLATTSGYQSSLVQTLLGGAQWDEGSSSNPILVLHKAIDASYMPVTGIGMSGQLWRAFIRNAAVQKYFQFKDGMPAIPGMDKVSSDFKLPPIYVDETKYTVGGQLSFVWGNDCYLIHQPNEMPPTSQMDVATSVTFRWVGGTVPPGGSLTGGMMVRSYFDEKRGPRGSTVVVCAHYDTELMTSSYVGGLVVNAYQ